MEKTTECSITDVEGAMRMLIQEHMDPSEEVLACFQVEYHMLWVEAITSRQVIVAKAIALRTGVIKSHLQIDMPRVSTMPIEEIDHFSMGRSQEYELFTVIITGKSGEKLETYFTQENWAKKFYQALAVASHKEAKSISSPSASTRLRELTDLLKDGLITEEEYQNKKAEILKSL